MTHEQVSHPGRRAIACNVREAGRVAATGALAYVRNPNFHNASDRVEVLVRSRGGRWVQRWADTCGLTNFRAATIPPQHARYDDPRMSFYEDADRRAEALYFYAGSGAVRGVGTRGRLGAARASHELAGHDGGATASRPRAGAGPRWSSATTSPTTTPSGAGRGEGRTRKRRCSTCARAGVSPLQPRASEPRSRATGSRSPASPRAPAPGWR